MSERLKADARSWAEQLAELSALAARGERAADPPDVGVGAGRVVEGRAAVDLPLDAPPPRRTSSPPEPDDDDDDIGLLERLTPPTPQPEPEPEPKPGYINGWDDEPPF